MTDRTGAPADPTAGFTDMQWYMYHQRNIAFFAAFSSRAFSDDELLTAARALVELAPQLRLGFAGADPARPIPDAVLRRLIYRESVASLEGFPERWLDRGDDVLADPALPLFRIRYAAASSPTPEGRHGFLIVQVSHALVEGEDSALLSRSQSAEHPVSASGRVAAPWVRAAATGVAAAVAGLHLLVGNLVDTRPGPFRFSTRVYPRLPFAELARQYGVRQRAVFYALVMNALFAAGTAQGRRRMSAAYSAIDDGGVASRDAFMRMRMLFTSFDNAPDFATFVRTVDARLSQADAKRRDFGDEMNARAVGMHRRLSRLMPFAYTPKLFQFMPYDVVLGLIPPHRLGGGLTAGLMEPVYAGAALEGANACVIVPNRRLVTFNFYIQQSLLPRVSRLDDMLGVPLSFRSETTV
jgi:hypothetical protein